MLLRVLLRELNCTQNSVVHKNNHTVSIRLNSEIQNNNLIHFKSQEKRLLLERVTNKEISSFLMKNIHKLENVDFFCSCCLSYIFKDGNNTVEAKSKLAIDEINNLKSGEDSILPEDVGSIFTVLNNAGIVDKKSRQKLYTTYIKVDLKDLSTTEIERYIQEICGAGGKLDKCRYMSSLKEHQRNKSEINPRLLAIMRTWVRRIFNGDIENWTDLQWEDFETKWGNQYKLYSPDPERVRNILIEDISTDKFDQRLCIYLYNFLKKISEESLSLDQYCAYCQT